MTERQDFYPGTVLVVYGFAMNAINIQKTVKHRLILLIK